MHMRQVDIMLVEDNPAEIRLMDEVLGRGRLSHRLHAVQDGDAAIAFLRLQGIYANAPRPDLILLDLNLPGVDGRAVLREVKGDPALREIPLIVLSSSEAEDDVRAAYAAHANCFVAKPVDFDGLCRVADLIKNFWFGAVRLPPKPAVGIDHD